MRAHPAHPPAYGPATIQLFLTSNNVLLFEILAHTKICTMNDGRWPAKIGLSEFEERYL